MKITEEKCFPRGGKEPTSEKSKILKKSSQNFKRKRDGSPSFLQNKGSKKIKLKQHAALTEISLKTLSEGMVILGCVREVSELELKINLPGRIIGYVPATKVSEEYSEYLKDLISGEEKEPVELSHIFKPGQFVVTKVEEISTLEEGKFKIFLTLNPNKIHGDLSFKDVMKGMIVSASVQSIEDHGYIMNCGIHGVRAFLKKDRAAILEEKWNDGRKLGVGQVVRCLVVKNSTSEDCANVELQADPEAVAGAQTTDDVPLNFVIPGMSFQVMVSKVTLSGLVVKFTDHHTGYVHLNYLNTDLKETEKGTTLSGRVLYIEPLTKNVFLTTMDNVCGPHLLPPPFKNFRKGQVFKQAKVVSVKGGHVVLELREDSGIYGYVTSRHLEIEITEDTDALVELVRTTYTIGSEQKCKVLEYDYMTQKYSCTLKRSIIKQKFSSLDEITPGLVTKCIVEKSTPREIILKVGAIRGIVEPMHCSDVPVRFADTLLQKGQKVKARVLAVKSPICEFTLKPVLVHSQTPILLGFDGAEYDIPYDGVIVEIKQRGVLVKFYGDFKCFIPLPKIMGGRKGELERTYYVGQVVTCYVKEIHFNEQRLILSVQPRPTGENVYEHKEGEERLAENVDDDVWKVGKVYELCVEDVALDGLTVREQASGLTGWIPFMQLTDNPQLANLVCQTYKNGDKLFAYCLNSRDNPIFTMSPTFMKFFESADGKKLTKKGYSALKEYMILPSTVTEISDESITVAIPLRKGEHYVLISKLNICEGTVEGVDKLNLQNRQTLMVQLTKVFKDFPSEGATKLSRVWNKAAMSEPGIMLLQNFLNCHKRICGFLKEESHPLGNLEIGSKVKGSVIAVTTLGAVLNLENGARAVMMPTHYEGVNLEENMIVEGTVIFVDVANQCVEVTLLEAIARNLSSLGKPPQIGHNTTSVVYVSRTDVLIAGIQCDKGFQIVYIPSRWHINDLRPSPYFGVRERGKISIRAYEEELAIAVPRKVEVVEKQYRMAQIKSTVDKTKGADINNGDGFVPFDISLEKAGSVKKEVTEDKKKKSKKNVVNGQVSNVNKEDKYIPENKIEESFSSAQTNKKNEFFNSVDENVLVVKKDKKKNKNNIENGEVSNVDMEDKYDSENEVQESFGSTHINVKNEHVNCIDENLPVDDSTKSKNNKKRREENSTKTNPLNHSESYSHDIKEVKKQLSAKEEKSVNSPAGHFTVVSLPVKGDEIGDTEIDARNKSKKDKKLKKVQLKNSESLSVGTSVSPSVRETAENCENDTKQVEEKCVVSDKDMNCSIDASQSSNHSSRTKTVCEKDEKRKCKSVVSVNEVKKESEKKNIVEKTCLNISAGFVWDATPDQLPAVMKQKADYAGSSSDDEPEEHISKKKKQRLTIAEKRALAREEEERLRKVEERLLNAEKNPQSADDFDRLVMSAPNNSQNWIKYMAHHLETTEVAKARAVGERALKTISFREEQEKLNVWMALLNLENLFGTKESLEKTLEEAVKMNDPYKVHIQALNMYSTTKKFEELEKLVQLVTKKYKDETKTWIEAGTAYMKCDAVEKSRQLMQRALKVLNRRDHVEILTRFALMENEWGEAERAETLMENILTSYPKRVDVWCVYVDMLVKSKKVDIARQVLERAVSQKLPIGRMRSLFKKYLKFEHEHGTTKELEKVREMAKSYVGNMTS